MKETKEEKEDKKKDKNNSTVEHDNDNEKKEDGFDPIVTTPYKKENDEKEDKNRTSNKTKTEKNQKQNIKKKNGNCIILCGTPEQYSFPRSCIVGPDWPCMLVTYAIISIPAIYILAAIGYKIHWTVEVLCACSLLCTFVSFSYVACSNPGYVFTSIAHYDIEQGEGQGQDQDDSVSNETSTVLCAQCHVRRPPKALHCYDCGMCVDELDHHCPWTGKCIGKRTIVGFYFFLAFILIHIMFTAGLYVYYYVTKANN